MAEADRVQLESLLQDVQSGEPGVQAMLAEVAVAAVLEPLLLLACRSICRSAIG